MPEQFDESPYTPEELAMLRTGEVTEIPAAQADQSLAMIYRKAAAFDALAAILTGPGKPSLSLDYWDYFESFSVEANRDGEGDDDSIHGPTLLEAVEAMQQTLKQSKGEA